MIFVFYRHGLDVFMSKSDDENFPDIKKIKDLTGAGANALFLDDWRAYHVNYGEVHCGSAALRESEENWWLKLN